MKDYSIIKSQYLSDISSAIRSKGGSSSPMYPKDMASNIMSLPSSGGSSSAVGTSYINFYDYDGTLLYSWTKDELDNKTELPDLPNHLGLICQGWNYTLSQIKDQNNPVNVGAMYITDDGCTRIKLVIAEDARLTQPLMFKGNVEIDWGDGIKSTHNNTSYTTVNHTYLDKGKYLISIKVLSGTLSLGGNSSSYNVCGSNTNSSTSPSRVYSNRIREVNIGNSVIISTYAFEYCYLLSSITIPNSVTTIGYDAFTSCYSLSSVTIPTSVTSISSYLFESCYSLSSVTIPNSVTSIGSRTFKGCRILTSITIPDSVTTIGYDAFCYCYLLSSITIPDSVTTIGDYAFASCYSLSSVTIPNSVTSIGSRTFESCYILSSITIPDSVTTIGDYAFYYCYSLTSLTIPNSVTSIDEYAFTSCYSLSSITISNSLTSVGRGIFTSCHSLTSLTIPNSVTSISTYAFGSCYGIIKYDFTSHTNVPTLSNTNAFSNIASECKIVVPDSLYDEWISATNWVTYASRIIKESEYIGE